MSARDGRHDTFSCLSLTRLQFSDAFDIHISKRDRITIIDFNHSGTPCSTHGKNCCTLQGRQSLDYATRRTAGGQCRKKASTASLWILTGSATCSIQRTLTCSPSHTAQRSFWTFSCRKNSASKRWGLWGLKDVFATRVEAGHSLILLSAKVQSII